MAMTTCGECEAQVSDRARACPSCGAPPAAAARRSETFLWLVRIGLAVVLFALLFLLIDNV